jgi:predicted transcriptional regulator
MALSAAARAALEQFKQQQSGSATAGLGIPEEADTEDSGGYEPAGWNRISDPSTAIKMGGLFRPEQPKSFKEAGISYRTLEGLLLKIIKQEGPQNEAQLADVMKISVNVFRDILTSLNKRELLDTPMPLHYDLTNKGRELVALVEREDGYVGPAPVSFSAYCQMVRQQAKRERRVTMEEVEEIFAGYPMRERLKMTLKEGFNSQRVMIYYGPPGNGKSLITDNLHRLLKEPVLLPYAFEYNSKVVQVYDPAFHKLKEDLMKQEEDEVAHSVSTAGKPDRRWLISEPPLVTVGTEFKVAQFDVAYDGSFFAPPHVKSNNGIFIFDDLGRQTEDHNMILNQFIYPLEQRESIIRFAGGSSMRVPFLQRLFLSTNLNHEEILDDAFKRRLLYQVLVDRPTTKLWKQIFVNEAAKIGIETPIARELGDHVVEWYKQDDRVFRACDPRNLMVMVDASLDVGQRAVDVLDIKKMRDIYERYPAAYRKDAKFFVGSMDSTGAGDEE